jgi:hypothetical protein
VSYVTEFDTCTAGYPWWVPGSGLAMLVGGVVWFLAPRLFGRREVPGFITIPYVLFAFLWTAVAGWSTGRRFLADCAELREHRATIAEGMIAKLRPLESNDGKEETFRLAGKDYRYSPYAMCCGLRKTSAKGGPIQERKRVRVSLSTAGEIIRVEAVRGEEPEGTHVH